MLHRNRTRSRRGVVALISIAVALSCTSPTTPGGAPTSQFTTGNGALRPGTYVSVTIADPELAIGDSTVATAVLRHVSGGVHTQNRVTWSSLNSAVATVSATGIVRAVGAGTAGIIAQIFDGTGSVDVTVNSMTAPVATQLGVLAQPAGGPTGAPLSVQPRIEVRDVNGAVVSGSSATVTASLVSSTGVLTGTTSVSATNGVATFTDLAIVGLGSHVLTFTADGLTGVTAQPVTIVAGPPARLAFEMQPGSTALSGAALSPQPSVSVRDSYGNPVAVAGLAVMASIASGGGVLGGTLTALTNASGVAEFTNLAINGASGTRTLAFSSPLLTSVTAPVIVTEQPASTRRIIFSSDWSSGLGTTSAALLDATKPSTWNLIGGVGLSVVPNTGLDFPTANVLRVDALTARSGFALLRKTGMPIPAVGERRSYRWYVRVAPGIEDANIHPIQDGNAAGDSNWQFETLCTTGGAGKWTPQFKFSPYNTNNQNFRGPALDVNRTYRFEIQLHRTGINAFNFHVRVYDTAGTLLYSNANFVNQSPGIASLAAQGTGQFSFLNVNNLDGLNVGSNGVSPLSSDRLFSHQGGIAVCDGDWCGAYVPGERPQ